MRYLLFLFAFTLSLQLWAQESNIQNPGKAIDKPKTSEPVQLHQLYFTDPVHKVKKVQYMDGTPVKFELSPNGGTLFLKDYFKRGRLNITVENEDGEEEEVSKSPCYIDPVVPT